MIEVHVLLNDRSLRTESETTRSWKIKQEENEEEKDESEEKEEEEVVVAAAAEEDRRRTRGRRRWKGRKQRARKYLMLHEDGEGKEEFKLIVALPRPEHLPEPHDALIVELSPEAQ